MRFCAFCSYIGSDLAARLWHAAQFDAKEARTAASEGLGCTLRDIRALLRLPHAGICAYSGGFLRSILTIFDLISAGCFISLCVAVITAEGLDLFNLLDFRAKAENTA